MALARSSAKVTETPLLVLHSDPYAPRALAHLSNVETRRVEKIANHHSPKQARFMDALTKLRIFDLLEYDRVTFIDADCIVRSEERRDGKECVSTCSSRWSP